jgi:hypothetical protein
VGERQIFELLTTIAREKIILFTTHRYDTISVPFLGTPVL